MVEEATKQNIISAELMRIEQNRFYDAKKPVLEVSGFSSIPSKHEDRDDFVVTVLIKEYVGELKQTPIGFITCNDQIQRAHYSTRPSESEAQIHFFGFPQSFSEFDLYIHYETFSPSEYFLRYIVHRMHDGKNDLHKISDSRELGVEVLGLFKSISSK